MLNTYIIVGDGCIKMKLKREQVGKIYELADEGKDPREIAKELGHNEGTVHRYLAIRNTTAGTALATKGDGIIIRPIGDVTKILATIMSEPEVSGETGQLTGVNLSQLVRQANRLKEGRGTPEEGTAFVSNVIGIGLGFWTGWRGYDELLPEEKKIAEQANLSTEEIIEKVISRQNETVAATVSAVIKQLKEEKVI